MMELKLDLRGKGTGKTQAMVTWLLENDDAVMLVINQNEKLRLLQAMDEKVRSTMLDRIMTLEQVQRLRGRLATQVGVDNVRLILESVLNRPVTYMTLTTNPGTTIIENLPQSMYTDAKSEEE